MREYTPDSWVPVLIESEEHGKIYKILCSWYGGYTGSDYWKLSSGIESITEEDGVLTMPQSSGSVYKVGRHTHTSSLMGGVFANWAKRAAEPDSGFTIKMIELDELLEAFSAQKP
jgi:CRISPR/Cas system type I-B associated protein Csh2 (Cas7 group RAMP superfamily)